jgi:hypothetical protein
VTEKVVATHSKVVSFNRWMKWRMAGVVRVRVPDHPDIERRGVFLPTLLGERALETYDLLVRFPMLG